MHDHRSFTSISCRNSCQSSITVQRTSLAVRVCATCCAHGPHTAVRRPSVTLPSSAAVQHDSDSVHKRAGKGAQQQRLFSSRIYWAISQRGCIAAMMTVSKTLQTEVRVDQARLVQGPCPSSTGSSLPISYRVAIDCCSRESIQASFRPTTQLLCCCKPVLITTQGVPTTTAAVAVAVLLQAILLLPQWPLRSPNR